MKGLAAALWCVASGLAAAASPTGNCVDSVDTTKLSAVTSTLPVEYSGELAIIDLGDDYSRGLTAPRQAVAASYATRFRSDVDFLIVWTGFEFATGDARAVYLPIRNDVSGIGQATFDHSAAFSSPSMQGYVDMAAFSRWTLNPRAPAFEETLDTLTHELMHRYGSYVHRRDEGGIVRADLLGREASHWSFLFDSDASVLYGNDWRDLGGGNFESIDTLHRYSALDQYLAGWISASEVGPMRLLQSAAADPGALPRRGARIAATVSEITLAQIIAAEGPRLPAAGSAQRSYRAGWVLLRRPGQTLTAELLPQLEATRRALESRFAAMSGGRATLVVGNRPLAALSAGLPIVRTGSGATDLASSLERAVGWLKLQQRPNGSFADKPGTEVRDTAAAVRALETLAPTWPGLPSARAWMVQQLALPRQVDDRSWALLGIDGPIPESVTALQGARGSESAWGLDQRYAPEALETALAARALGAQGVAAAETQQARQWLLAAANADGSFGVHRGGAGRSLPTLWAVRALSGDAGSSTLLTSTRQWLRARQGNDGGLGDGGSDALLSAEGLLTADALGSTGLDAARLLQHLLLTQQVAGDWQGSVYTTAQATLALSTVGRPNLRIRGALQVLPMQPTDGETALLRAEIENTGRSASGSFLLRWYDGDPAQAGRLIGSTTVADLDSGARLSQQLSWIATPAGAHSLYVWADAGEVVAESSEADNQSRLDLIVAAPPSTAELALTSVSLQPAVLSTVPATIRVIGTAQNLGLSPASVRVALTETGSAVVLAEAQLTLGAQSSAPLDLSFTVSSIRALDLQLRIDPDNQYVEANENNNLVGLRLALANAVDLALASADISLLTDPALLGSDVRWRVRVRNRGTSPAPTTTLRASIRAGGDRIALPEQPIAVDAGQSVERIVQWRADRAGPIELEVEADPGNQITESDEGNNLATLPTQIARADQPDLTVDPTRLLAIPNPAAEGAALQVRAVVRNLGGSASPPASVRLYAADPRANAQVLGETSLPAIASGAEEPVELNVSRLQLAGDQTFYVYADAALQVSEQSENNNLGLLPLRVLRLPDLASSLAGVVLTPSAPASGQPVELRVGVRNLGEQPAVASSLEVEVGGVTVAAGVVPALGPGASTEVVINWTWGGSASSVRIRIDATALVGEGNEDNNLLELPVSAQNARLYADHPVFSPNGDGIHDQARVALRMSGVPSAVAEISFADGRLVQRYAAELIGNPAQSELIWDGRDQRGRVVPDGAYLLRTYARDGAALELLELTVDNNRSSILDAIVRGVAETLDLNRQIAAAEWRAPPDLSPWRMQLYALLSWPPSTPQPAGVYSVHPHDRQLRAVISGAWVAQQANGALGASIRWFEFTPNGDALVFELERTLQGGTREYSLWRTALDSVDAPQRLAASSVAETRLYLGAFDRQHYALLRGDVLERLDLLSGELVVLATATEGLSADRPIGPGGILVTPTTFIAGRYYPNASGPAVAIPPADPSAEMAEYVPNATGSHVLRLEQRAEQFRLTLIDAARGTQVLLREVPRERAGFPGDPWNEAQLAVTQALHAQWLEGEDAFAVYDGQSHRISLIGVDGQVQADSPLPALARLGLYRSDGLASVCNDPVPAVFATTGLLASAVYDPWSRTLLLDHEERATVRFYCGPEWSTAAGVAEMVSVDVATMTSRLDGRCEAAESLELIDASDRARYACAADFGAPRLILRDGSRIAADGRVRSSDGTLSQTPWSDAGHVRALWSDQAQLLLDDGTLYTHYLNLSARLQARSAGRRIVLSGVAADRNLDYYELEWARASAPDVWYALSVPQREEVRGEEFLAYTPAEPGDLRFRLRVVDRAGNVAIAYARARSADPGAIDLEQVSPRAFSPNGDSVQDQVELRFRVLAAVSTRFEVHNAAGIRVRQQDLVYGNADLGPKTLAWDGRDDGGAPLPDGRYQVSVDGQTWWVTLDTVPPQLRLEASAWYRADTEGGAVSAGLPTLRMGCFEAATRAVGGCGELQRQADLNAPIERVRGLEQCGDRPGGICAVHTSSDAGRERWRLAARDDAGNQALTPWQGPQAAALVLHGVRPPAEIDPAQLPVRVRFQPLPFDVNAPADVGSVFTGARLQLLDGTVGSTEIELQARAPGGVGGWRQLGRWPIADVRVCSSYAVGECAQRGLELPLDLRQEVVGASLDLRAVARGGSGGDSESNRIRINVPGLGTPQLWSPGVGGSSAQALRDRMPPGEPGVRYNYIYVESHLPGTLREPVLAQPAGVTRPESVISNLVAADTSGLMFRLEQCTTAPVEILARAALRGSTQRSPRVTLTLIGQPEGTTCSGGSPGSSGLNRLKVQASPRIGARCGAAPTGGLQISVEAESVTIGPQQQLRLLQMQGGTVVATLAVRERANSQAANFVETFDVDTAGIPLGAINLRAELIGTAASLRADTLAIIDRTPPAVALTQPAPGGRVCAGSGVNVSGQVQEANGYALALDYGLSANVGTWFCARATPRMGLRSYCTAPAGEDLIAPATTGLLYTWAETAPPLGTVSLRLRASDWSGAEVCSTSTFELDSGIDWNESRPAETWLDPINRVLGLAPEGRAAYRQARLWRSSGESVDLTLSLHRMSSAYVIDPAPLASLFSQSGLSGETMLSWDGRRGGVVADDGWYALRVHATDSCGHADQVDARVLLDATAPMVSVGAPQQGATLVDPSIALVAGFDDAHADQWLVEFGLGTDPATWEQIAQGSGNRPLGSVLANWARGTREGLAVLRFSATDALGNRREQRVSVILAPRVRIVDRAELVPAAFSPNADGRQDLSRAQLLLAREARVSVRVLDAQGAVLRELANAQSVAAGPASWDWDGRSAAGVLQPEGVYRIDYVAQDSTQASVQEQGSLQAQLDLTPPALTITRPAGGYLDAGLVLWSVDDSLLRTAQARLYELPGNALRTEQTVLQNGAHTLIDGTALQELRYRLDLEAEDLAGNSTRVSREFRVDRTPPILELGTPLNGSVWARGASTAVQARVDDAHLASWTFQIRPVGGSNWSDLAQGSAPLPTMGQLATVVPTLVDGDYDVRLLAQDHSGSESSALRSISIDGTPPQAVIDAPAAGAQVGSRFELRGSATDAHLLEYRVSLASPAQAAAGTWTDVLVSSTPVSAGVLGLLADLGDLGPQRLRLRAVDRAGLVAEVQRDLVIDALPPATPTGLAAVVLQNRDVRLSWNASAGASGYWLSRLGALLSASPLLPTEYLDALVPEGRLRYQVRSVDEAGNESAPSAPVEVVVDRTPPLVLILQPRQGERVRGVQRVQGVAYAEDDFARFELSLSQGGVTQLLQSGTQSVVNGTLGTLDTRSYAEGSVLQLRLSARDTRANEASVQLDLVVDNQPPAAPQGLVLAEQGADVRAEWQPNIEPDLLGYLLFRDEQLVNGPAALPEDLRAYARQTTQYQDPAVGDGTRVYRVYAIDTAGNVSAPSAPVSISIEHGAPKVLFLSPASGTAFEREVLVEADSPDRDVIEMRFEARSVNGSFAPVGGVLTQRPFQLRFQPTDLGDYEIRASARDSAGLNTIEPPVLLLSHVDRTPPGVVTAVSARADGNAVDVQWPAVDAADLAGYRVNGRRLSDGASWQSDLLTGLSARHENAEPGHWRYQVRAYDAAGNAAEPTAFDEAEVYALDLLTGRSPTSDSMIAVEGLSTASGTVEVELTDAGGTQTRGPYRTDESGAYSALIPGLANGDSQLRVRVRNDEGDRSSAATALVQRGALPAAPTGLAAIINAPQVQLSWAAEPGLRYRVWRDGGPVPAEVSIPGPYVLSDSGGALGPPVLAFDQDPQTAWSIGVVGPSLRGTYLQTEWPSALALSALRIQYAAVEARATAVDLWAWSGQNWVLLARQTGAADASVEIAIDPPYLTDRLRIVPRGVPWTGYQELQVAEVELRHLPMQSAGTLTDVPADGRHRYRVAAISALGLQGPQSAEITVAVGDVDAPDAPVLSGAASGNNASLEWTASVAPDVAYYRLYRDDTLIASLPATVRTQLDQTLRNGRYRYVVRAVDAAGNASDPSNTLTLDISAQLPGTPVGLSITAPPRGAELSLQWQPGPGAAPTQYQLRRSLDAAGPYTQLPPVSDSSYLDSGLENGTRYYYTVEAIDAAGNRSAPTAPVSGLPRDLDPPPAPQLSYPGTAGTVVDHARSSTDLCAWAPSAASIEWPVVAGAGGATSALTSAQRVRELPPSLANPESLLLAASGRSAWITRSGASTYVRLDDLTLQAMPSGLIALSMNGDGDAMYARASTGQLLRIALPGGESAALDLGLAEIDALLPALDEHAGVVMGRELPGGTTGLWWFERDSLQRTQVSGVDATQVDPGSLRIDGTADAVLLRQGSALIWAQREGSSVQVHANADGVMAALTLDGSRAVFGVRDGIAEVLWLRERGSAVNVQFKRFEEFVGALSWVGNAHLQLTTGTHWWLYRTDEPNTPMQLATLPGAVRAQSPAGRMIVGDGPVAVFDPAFLSCQRGLVLAPGINTLRVHALDAAGNRSLPSAAIQLRRPDADRPDLAVSVAEIAVDPPQAQPGQAMQMRVTVRNLGNVAAAASRLRVAILRDATPVRALTAAVPALARGVGTLINVQLGSLDATGTYQLRVQVDADAVIAESDESNNSAARDYWVALDGAPQLELELSGSDLAPGDPLLGEVRVRSGNTLFQGQLQLRIEDHSGALVAMLADESTGALQPGAVYRRSFQQDSSALLAGAYRVRAQLRSAGNLIQDEMRAFNLQALREFELAVTPLQPSYSAGSQAELALRVRYRAGNVYVSGAQLALDLTPAAGGAPAYSWQRALGGLEPGFEAQQTLRLSTTGIAPGNYIVRMELSAPDGSWQAQSLLALTTAQSSTAPSGTLGAVPAPVVLGMAAAVQYAIQNPSELALSNVPVRVAVRRAADLSIVAQAQINWSVPALGTMSGELPISTAALAPEPLLATLEWSSAPDQWTLLAIRSVDVIDGLPPELTTVLPGAFAPQPAAMRVQVVDAHSALERTEVRVDGDQWRPAYSLGTGQYGRSVSGLAEGTHEVRFRSADVWGNQAETVPHSFIVDATPPVIQITGVSDGQLSRTPLTPVVTITDAHPGSQTLLLDGRPFVSGTAVASEGAHTLEVGAVDLAGNRANLRLAFTIDSTAPAVAFVTPANGASISAESVDVSLSSEALATVQLTTGAYSAQRSADAQGAVSFAAVPLLPGTNQLRAQASDVAGNLSAPVLLNLVRSDDPAAVLIGAVQVASASVEPGTVLQVSYSVTHTGNQARPGQMLRMQLRNALGQVLVSDERTRDFAVAGSYSETFAYATAGYPLGTLSFALDAAGPSGYVNLAVGTATMADLTAPALTLLAPTPGAVLRAPVTIRASASDALSSIASVELALDGGSWQALAPDAGAFASAALDLAEGPHAYALRATDGAGNIGQLQNQSLTVDLTPPVISISGVVDGQLSRDPLTPVIVISDAHPGTSSLRLNGASYSSGTPVSASGEYQLDVQAEDAAGNSAAQSLRFRIDRDPPALSFLQPANNAVILTDTVSVIGQTEAGASVTLSAGSFQTLTSAGADGRFLVPDVPLQVGGNAVQARATDPAGNQGATATLTLEYRANAGITLKGSVQAQPDPAAHGGSVSITATVRNTAGTQARALPLRLLAMAAGSSSDWARHEYAVTLAPGAQVEESWMLSLAGQGLGLQRIVLEGYFTDSQGVQAWIAIAERTFSISDQTGPTVAIVSPATQSIHGASVAVEASAEDPLSGIGLVEARLGSGFWIALSPKGATPGRFVGTLTAQAEGDTQLRVRAYDLAGNLAVSEARPLRIDLRPPQTTITGVPATPVNQPVTPQVDVQDGSPVQVDLRLNGAPYVAGTTVRAEGSYRLDVEAVDAAGNTSRASASFVIDLTPPAVVIAYPTPGTRTKRSGIEVLGSAEPGASVRVLAPGYAANAVLNPLGQFGPLRVPLLVGDNPISAEARDAAGNIGRAGPVVVVRESNSDRGLIGDLTGPTELVLGANLPLAIQLQNLSTQNLQTLTVRIRALAGERVLNTEQRNLTLNAGDFSRFDLIWSSASWPAGRIDLLLERVDGARIEVLDRYSLTAIDRVPPELAILTPQPGQVMAIGERIRVRAIDVHSALAAVELRFDSGAWTTLTPDTSTPDVWQLPLPALSAGNHQMYARATDAGGNSAGAGPVEFRARAILPLQISEPADGAQLPPGLIDLVGTTQAQATVRVRRVGSTDERSAIADADGRFRVTGVMLPDGEQRYEIQASNAAGDTSDMVQLRLVGFDPVRIPIPLLGPLAALILLLSLLGSAYLQLDPKPRGRQQ